MDEQNKKQEKEKKPPMDTSFYDLPQEVLSLIFGYTAGVELVEISSLFRTVIQTCSKHLLHNLNDYIQQTPLEIDQTSCRNIDTRARAMAWACRKKIKLRKCHFVYKSPSLDLCIIEYVLHSCDICYLESFGVNYHGECSLDDRDYLVILMKQGFPREMLVYEVYRLKSRNDIRKRIIDALIHRANKKKLRKMTLGVFLTKRDVDWILRLLQHFQSLEELCLCEETSGFMGATMAIAEDMYKVLAAIEGLSSLRRLELINVNFFPVEGEAPLKIVSHTLECLCIHQSPTLLIEECVCPNLKVLSVHHSYSTRLVTELEGGFPYGMQVRKVCDVIPSWNDASDVCVSFDFITRPIQKYSCPDTCTVLFIPNAMDISYDGDYYGSDLQDDDYEYLVDSEEVEDDDYYEDDEVDWYEDDEFDNDLMNVVDDFEETTLLDNGEEDHENNHP